VKAISEVFPYLTTGKVISMASGTGNRTDEYIMEFGRALAGVYDRIIVTDSDPRGRPPGETAELVRKGILDAGFSPDKVSVVVDPVKATAAALESAAAGDLVVLQADHFNQVIRDVKEYKKRLLENR
jgi:cyanophycin synthetase